MSLYLQNQFQSSKKVLLKNFSGASFAQHLVQTHQEIKQPVIIITEDSKRAGKLSDEILFFAPQTNVQTLTPYDVLPYYGLSPHPQILSNTLQILYQLRKRKIDFLIVPKLAFLRKHLPQSLFDQFIIKLSQNEIYNREELIQKLIQIGYERSPLVEEVGQFAIRGDILDIYSPQFENPVRFSFFDQEIEWIKTFDLSTQRTTESLYEADLIPTKEIFLNLYQKGENNLPTEINLNWKSDLKSRADNLDILKTKRDQVEDLIQNQIYFHGIETFLPLFYKTTSTLFDYLPENTIIIRDTLDTIEKDAALLLDDLKNQHDQSEHIEKAISYEELFLTPNEIEVFQDFFSIHDHEVPLSTTHQHDQIIDGQTQSNQIFREKLKAQIAKVHNLAPLASELNQKRLEGFQCLIVCSSQTQLERMEDLLKRFELPLSILTEEKWHDFLKNPKSLDSRLVYLFTGSLHEGFLNKSTKQWWLTDEEVFGQKIKKSTRKSQKTTVFSSFSELTEGDYIIHMDHGIGIYQGLIKLDFDVYQNDFMMIEYLGGDKLYVPVDKLNRVQRYSAEEGAVPQLDKLGGTTWQKVRSKAKRAARKLAAELLKLQAKRESQKGYVYSSHHEEIHEFESQFEFEETPDQLRTIEEVYKDMESEKPMDRLICGDVGFGKTEVAIRAAYKAILDHKQVAILVPTTVLAFQHYTTFKKRFENYALNTELLSRFRSTKEQNDVVKKLKRGEVDIVVGTHRLLSKDIEFRDLGLLIIDEEHRFGVVHKEKIKKLRNLVDVVTLTATPIPRTLNFALNGIRDLSIINTPPEDRLAVKTYLCSFEPTTLRDAMLKEIKRGGQVYFVHNRVKSIEKICKQVSEMLPEARVRFAHGQMAEDDLEKIMIDFMNHEFDVLVCTTIIESGLDIPNANTMIINRADHMGLAQLYQLRGRVGRSYHQAYCYLIAPDEELVTTKAKKRLAAIQRFTQLGSGFKIASHDLEIRGAGNILGDEQSGQIAAIGYDMYIHLLKEAIDELKHKHVPEDFSPEVTLNLSAKIPEDFIPDSQMRLILYKQLSSSENLNEVDDYKEDWTDRFGKLPHEISNLMSLIKIRILCRELLVASIKQSAKVLIVTFHPEHQIDTQLLIDAIQRKPKEFGLSREGQFLVNKTFENESEKLNWILEFLEKLKENASS